MQSEAPEITSECPCTGHCSMVLGDEVNRDSLRTFDEVTRWVNMSEDGRHWANLRIATEQSLS